MLHQVKVCDMLCTDQLLTSHASGSWLACKICKVFPGLYESTFIPCMCSSMVVAEFIEAGKCWKERWLSHLYPGRLTGKTHCRTLGIGLFWDAGLHMGH